MTRVQFIHDDASIRIREAASMDLSPSVRQTNTDDRLGTTHAEAIFRSRSRW
jgi:hypothetical protein